MSKRVKRDNIKLSEDEIMKPLDIEKFGSDDDPCFGKLYNLGTDECKRCGDSEICGIVFAQKMNKDRTAIEKKTRFKDMELTKDRDDIKVYVKKLKKEGYNRLKIIRLSKKKFLTTKQEILKYL